MGNLLSEIDEEFFPLPAYTWEVRPSTIPVDVEEAATALYLNKGVVADAAARLRIEPLKLQRIVDRSPRLTRLHRELVALLNDKVLKQVIVAFDDPENRRQEWAAAQVIRSEAFRSHPLAPVKDNQAPSINVNTTAQEIVFSWKTPEQLDKGGPLIENSFDEKNKSTSD